MDTETRAFRAGLGAALLAAVFAYMLLALTRRAASYAVAAAAEDGYARGWMVGFGYGHQEAEREGAINEPPPPNTIQD